MVRSKVIERREELSFRQIAGSAKDHNGARVDRLRSGACFHTNQVSWINFDVATELIAHGRQHLFGLPRLAMECSRVKLLGDLSRGRLPRSPPLRGFCAWFPAEVAMTEGEFEILRASLGKVSCSATDSTRIRKQKYADRILNGCPAP